MVRRSGPKRKPPAATLRDQKDYIPHGSIKHMEWLGLRKVKQVDEEDLTQYGGYEMVDITMFGVNAQPAFLRNVLMQKVNEYTMPIPVPQSADPLAPHYAPPMWQPDDIPTRGIV